MINDHQPEFITTKYQLFSVDMFGFNDFMEHIPTTMPLFTDSEAVFLCKHRPLVVNPMNYHKVSQGSLLCSD